MKVKELKEQLTSMSGDEEVVFYSRSGYVNIQHAQLNDDGEATISCDSLAVCEARCRKFTEWKFYSLLFIAVCTMTFITTFVIGPHLSWFLSPSLWSVGDLLMNIIFWGGVCVVIVKLIKQYKSLMKHTMSKDAK